MIYCNNKNYFKVFKVTEFDKSIRYSVGTSEERNGSYRKSYWDLFVYKSNLMVPRFSEGDTIVAEKLKIENVWNSEKQKNYLSVVLLEGSKYERA